MSDNVKSSSEQPLIVYLLWSCIGYDGCRLLGAFSSAENRAESKEFVKKSLQYSDFQLLETETTLDTYIYTPSAT